MWRSPKTKTSLPLRNSFTTLSPAEKEDNTPYLFGGIGGLLAGLLGAYFYKRGADDLPDGREKVSALQILSVATSMIAMLRLISELGKPKK